MHDAQVKPRRHTLDLFAHVANCPAYQAKAVQNIKLTVPCSVLLSQWQQNGLLCRFCCQDGLKV